MRSAERWDLLAGLILIAIAVIRPHAENQRDLLAFSFRCGAIILFAAWMYQCCNQYVGAFLMLAVFSHSVPGLILSGGRQLQTDQSYIALNMVLAGCAYYAVVVDRCTRIDRLTNAICVLALLHIASMPIMQWAKNPAELFRSDVCGLTGITANPNESSAMLAICAPAFFRRPWGLLLPVVMLGLVLSKSFGGVLGFASAVCLYALLRGGAWTMAGLGSAAILATVLSWTYIKPPNFTRWHAWEKAIRLTVANHPIVGFGLGNWQAIYPGLVKANAFPGGWLRLHSSFVQGVVETGVIFPAIVAGFIVDAWRRYADRAILPAVALAPIAVACATNSMFRMNALNAMIALTWLAILEIRLREA